MNNKILNKILMIFKSIWIILLLILFSTIFFSIFNINPNNISDKMYVVYLTTSELVLTLIFFIIYGKTLVNDFNEFKKDINGNLEFAFRYWVVGFMVMVVSNLFITLVLGKTIAGNEEAVRNYIGNCSYINGY